MWYVTFAVYSLYVFWKLPKNIWTISAQCHVFSNEFLLLWWFHAAKNKLHLNIAKRSLIVPLLFLSSVFVLCRWRSYLERLSRWVFWMIGVCCLCCQDYTLWILSCACCIVSTGGNTVFAASMMAVLSTESLASLLRNCGSK